MGRRKAGLKMGVGGVSGITTRKKGEEDRANMARLHLEWSIRPRGGL